MAEQDPHPEALPQEQAHPEDKISQDLDDTKQAPMQCNPESTSDQPAANAGAMPANSADGLQAGNIASLSDEATIAASASSANSTDELLHGIDGSSAAAATTTIPAAIAMSANPTDALERKRQKLLDHVDRLPSAATDEEHEEKDAQSDTRPDDHYQPRTLAPRLAEAAPGYLYRDDFNSSHETQHRRYDIQKEAAWSPDGSCVLSSGHDHCLTTTLLFPKKNTPPDSATVSRYEAPERITAFTSVPWFDTEQDGTMLALVSVADLPTRLFNVNEPTKKLASYSLMWDTDDGTELKVGRIKFKPCGKQFICTSGRSIAIFDINKASQGPVTHKRTVPPGQKKKNKRTLWGPKHLSGTISDFDYNCQGMLAVGTYERQLGFYSDFGGGELLWALNLAEIYDSPTPTGPQGIMWVRWSPDGNYLYVVERQSDVVLVMDVRKHDHAVSVLTGRHAMSSQRLGFDLIHDDYGHHVVAGGTDGVVRIWENPSTCNEESKRPDAEWKAHDTAVSSVLENPRYPQYFITVTGQIEYTKEEDYNSTSDSESSNSKSSETLEPEDGEANTGKEEDEENDEGGESSSSDESSDSDNEPEGTPPGMAPRGWMKIWEF